MAIKNSGGDEGAVVVKVKAGGPRFYGKRRDPEDRTRQVEVPIGAAWVVAVGDSLAKANGLTIGRVVEGGVARLGFEIAIAKALGGGAITDLGEAQLDTGALVTRPGHGEWLILTLEEEHAARLEPLGAVRQDLDPDDALQAAEAADEPHDEAIGRACSPRAG